MRNLRNPPAARLAGCPAAASRARDRQNSLIRNLFTNQANPVTTAAACAWRRPRRGGSAGAGARRRTEASRGPDPARGEGPVRRAGGAGTGAGGDSGSGQSGEATPGPGPRRHPAGADPAGWDHQQRDHGQAGGWHRALGEVAGTGPCAPNDRSSVTS